MADDDIVTSVLVLASIAGPALLWAARRPGPGAEDPDVPPPRRGATKVAGGALTLFGWSGLALWIWLSGRHWGMM